MATLTIKAAASWQAELRVGGTNLRERGSLRRAGSGHPQYICLRRTMTFPPSSQPVWTPRPPPRLPRLMFLVSVHRRGGYSSFSVHRRSCLRLQNQNCLMALRKKKCNTRESEHNGQHSRLSLYLTVYCICVKYERQVKPHSHASPLSDFKKSSWDCGQEKRPMLCIRTQLQAHCLIQNNRI